MPKTKYYFDKENLSFKPVKRSKLKSLSYVLLFVLGSLLFGFFGILILYKTNIIYSPRELHLQRQIKENENQFTILNKKMEEAQRVLDELAQRDNNLYRTYFEIAPISQEKRQRSLGGVNRYNYLEDLSNTELLKKNTERLESIQKQIAIQSQSLDEIIKLAKEQEQLLQTIPAIQPVQNKDLTRMASGYGWRTDPFTKAKKFHYGMDFSAPIGTPVYASGDGVVVRADNNSSGYGEHIRIDHGFGYESLYGHLSKYNVRPGQKVKRGDVIGFVGNTGRSQGPHLHYEVKKKGQHLNPINFYYGNLTPEEYEQMLKQSQTENQSFD